MDRSSYRKDWASPETIVTALYDVISGPANEERDWSRFRSLFFGGARIIIASGSPDGRIESGKEWSVDGFVEAAEEYYRQNGFWEREITGKIEQFGNIAHSFSTYESRVGSEESDPIGRGINSIQLIRQANRWWVIAIVFDVERPDRLIPKKYLS
jgi:hypothetical protein